MIARIRTGSLSNAIAISPNGKMAYVVNNIWGTVTPINTTTNKASKNTKLGGHPVYIVMAQVAGEPGAEMGNWKRPWSAVAVSALGLAGVLSGQRVGLGVAASGGWGKAITLPGRPAPAAISCWSPGNCGAVGSLGGSLYLLSQASGSWGRPKVIPGTARTSSRGPRSAASSASRPATASSSGPTSTPKGAPGVHRQPSPRHLGQDQLGPGPGQSGPGTQRRAQRTGVPVERKLHRRRVLHRRQAGTGLPFVVSQVHGGIWGSASGRPT